MNCHPLGDHFNAIGLFLRESIDLGHPPGDHFTAIGLLLRESIDHGQGLGFGVYLIVQLRLAGPP